MSDIKFTNAGDYIQDQKDNKSMKIVKTILIKRCSDSMKWYADLVGTEVPYIRTVPAYPQGTVEYQCREPAGYINFVSMTDGTIITREVSE
mgnify:FL=1|jgi:hypothetical protein